MKTNFKVEEIIAIYKEAKNRSVQEEELIDNLEKEIPGILKASSEYDLSSGISREDVSAIINCNWEDVPNDVIQALKQSNWALKLKRDYILAKGDADNKYFTDDERDALSYWKDLDFIKIAKLDTCVIDSESIKKEFNLEDTSELEAWELLALDTLVKATDRKKIEYLVLRGIINEIEIKYRSNKNFIQDRALHFLDESIPSSISGDRLERIAYALDNKLLSISWVGENDA